MLDYQKGKIYKLWSPSKNLVYYGSTTETISRRLSGHLKKYRQYINDNTKHNCSSRLILECEDYKIELVEEYPCNNKQQLCKKEGEYQKANECVNYVIAGRTQQEWYNDNTETVLEQQKQYYKLNADKVCERTKKYYDANADKMKEQRRQRYLRDKELKTEKIENV